MEDDVAHIKWRDNWRMPSIEELRELYDNCTWIITTINGIKGYKATSNKPGYEDRYIFLPFAGYRSETELWNLGSGGGYWSSSLHSGDPCLGAELYFGSGGNRSIGGDPRYYGRTVRPVCP